MAWCKEHRCSAGGWCWFVIICALGFLCGKAPASTLTAVTLHAFAGYPDDGAMPAAGLVLASDGSFYGTTSVGGVNNDGTVFKITRSGAVSILHSFGDYDSVKADGVNPDGGVILAGDGNLYGTTLTGGADNCGTLFKITPSGQITILHSFGDDTTPNDGLMPLGRLIQAGPAGDLYGMTQEGGKDNSGTIFKMTLSGSITILHSFCDGSIKDDGMWPSSGLIQAGPGGDFYGTTAFGGSTAEGNSSSWGYGTVFKVTPTGSVTILHSFGDGSVKNDGSAPCADLVQARSGEFYGTTEHGGAANGGTVFKITASGIVTILHSFGSGSMEYDAIDPCSCLIQTGPGGDFYGTTARGGLANSGTVFAITPGGSLSILYSFGSNAKKQDGAQPMAGLVQAADGSIYGTTFSGGDAVSGDPTNTGMGLVFKISAATKDAAIK